MTSAINRTALVTGAAGFIGYHVSQRLLADGYTVIGFDGMSDYYDVALKRARVDRLESHQAFTFIEGLLETDSLVMELFETHRPDVVVHLAAQAGVRWSIENPKAYLDANLIGVFNILEAARAYTPVHLLMASTSSAYGANTAMPYAETMRADHQMSFYAATKKPTRRWRTPMPISTIYPQRCSGFSPFTALGHVPIWHRSSLPKLF